MENFTGTNYSDMSRIYLYNNLIRARLLNRTKSLDNDIDKINARLKQEEMQRKEQEQKEELGRLK